MTPDNFERAGVMGWPVSHSLSPRLHGFWLKEYGINGSYEALPVKPDELESQLKSLPEKGFAGVNLTIPHKESALGLMDELDEVARKVGAVNTVIVRSGKLYGTNTDVYGFIQNLKHQTDHVPAGKALVLGSGGAARAACYGLLQEGWVVTLAGRTLGKAEALARAMENEKIDVADWNDLGGAMRGKELLVNTTPLGMSGQAPLEVSLETLPISAWVYDIVYTPLITPLLQAAKIRNDDRIVTGFGMLAYQAQPAFKAWFGIEPEVSDALTRHVLEPAQ